MARVLIVGGAGYVGSHSAKAVALAGHDVVTFDNLSTGHRELVKYGRFIKGDILDTQKVETTFVDVKPEVVMHFAAKSLVGESVHQAPLYYETNVTGSLNLIRALLKHAPQAKFIFSSSCSVYGVTDEPISELQPLAPTNPYARTKRIVEDMLADSKITHVSLRYFNAAGADSAGEIGEWHEPESHLIPRLLLHVLDPASYPMVIHGNDYPTPDGTCVRDYVHVEDLADAHRLAMDYLLRGAASDIFNLGTAKGSSVLEVIQQVEKVTGKRLSIPIGPKRAGDPPRLVAGSKKATNVLNWRPKHNLESIVQTAWKWTQKL